MTEEKDKNPVPMSISTKKEHLGHQEKMMKRIRRINPVGMRVVVKIEKEAAMTESGLYIPDNAKSNTKESTLAEIVEVASATDISTYEETNISGVPLGAKVLIAREAGIKVPWDDNLRIVETAEILALIEEMDIV